MMQSVWNEQAMRVRLKYGLPLTPGMQDMAARSKRAATERWLSKHPDEQLRRSVDALKPQPR